MSLEVLYLSKKDVEKVGLSMAEIIETVEDSFREKVKAESKYLLNQEFILDQTLSYMLCQLIYQA